jgi:hypothetical protein
MIKQARKHKVQKGFSKYGLCMNISNRNSGPFTTQRTVEATMPRQGGLKFKTYNSGKITR